MCVLQLCDNLCGCNKYVTSSCAADNVQWNAAEIECFQQALVKCDKDFVKISQHVSIDTDLNES